MNWTKIKPTEKGFYWYRDEADGERPVKVDIGHTYHGSGMAMFEGEYFTPFEYLDGGEWGDKIEKS